MDALSVLCAQLTRDMLVIVKFLFTCVANYRYIGLMDHIGTK